MINSINFSFGFPSHFESRVRLSLAITFALFSFPALAQTYPVSGVWVAEGHHFPGKAEACAALKILGLDAVRDESFPRVVIFSGGKRFEVRPDYQAERAIRTIKSEGGGDFRITEWLGERRRWPWSRRRSYTLRILGPANIGITEGKITTRFGKCSTISPSL